MWWTITKWVVLVPLFSSALFVLWRMVPEAVRAAPRLWHDWRQEWRWRHEREPSPKKSKDKQP